MIGIIIALILLVFTITIPITAVLVNRWQETFMILAWFVMTLSLVNLILILFNVY